MRYILTRDEYIYIGGLGWVFMVLKKKLKLSSNPTRPSALMVKPV